MRTSMAGLGRLRAGCFAAAAAGTLLLGLAGCATPQSETGMASEVVTPSDETEVRKRARIRLELASGYFEEGKVEIALDELKQVIAIDPTFADAYNMRGLIYMRLGDNRQAEDSFRRALAINPRDPDAHHNYGWLQCQQGRYPESFKSFQTALANPIYAGRSKSMMLLGLCQARGGLKPEAEATLARAYELDAGNPIIGYNLAQLLFQRGDYNRAQFYIRRLNNSDLANAETLWLGIKVEQRMNDKVATDQLGDQLRKRFPQSKERQAFDRGAFNE
jgi:type IV pilus assembly protein PilF